MKVVISLYLENAIILAAGASRRLGQPKALVEINGKTLIEILITRLKKFNLNIVIVTRPDLEEECALLVKKSSLTQNQIE